jgi:hypothetical protein
VVGHPDRIELAGGQQLGRRAGIEAISVPVSISDGPSSDRLHDGPRANTLDGAADSTALAALLRSNDELSSNGAQTVTACPPGPARRLLTMTSLDDRLILAPHRPGALAQARRA